MQLQEQKLPLRFDSPSYDGSELRMTESKPAGYDPPQSRHYSLSTRLPRFWLADTATSGDISPEIAYALLVLSFPHFPDDREMRLRSVQLRW